MRSNDRRAVENFFDFLYITLSVSRHQDFEMFTRLSSPLSLDSETKTATILETS